VTAGADAYSVAAPAWADGPVRIYGALAELLVARAPIALRGCRVLDLGTGTGAASRPAIDAGAQVTAVDNALGMLQANRTSRPPGVVADAVALPLHAETFDGVLAAFSLNHLDDPAAGVREAARVLRRRGVLLASTYANDDDHPVKHVVDVALGECGWQVPSWYLRMKQVMAAWGTVTDATATVERGGMEPVSVERLELSFPDLAPDALVRWRLGMAQSAAFVETLDDQQRRAVARRAVELLGPDPEVLVRRVIFIVARAR
jgi:SAM-dependent methyltransferase